MYGYLAVLKLYLCTSSKSVRLNLVWIWQQGWETWRHQTAESMMRIPVNGYQDTKTNSGHWVDG